MFTQKKHIFSEIEKKTFLTILKNYSHIIENKNTDGVSLKQKNQAWEKIVAAYNASPHSYTPVQTKQLRRLWTNLKQRQRDALAKERGYVMATGGGPSTSSVTIDADVAQIAPALIIGVESAIDSDAWDFNEEITVEPHIEDVGDTMEPMPVSDTTTEIQHQPQLPIIIPPQPFPHNSTPTQTQHLQTPTPRQPMIQNSIPTSSPQQPLPNSFSRLKKNILEIEYRDRKRRAEELHEMELKISNERLREARAKADMAELLLQRATDTN